MTVKDYTNIVGYIYKITSPNGKVYIGQTATLERRKADYKNMRFKQQTKLWNYCKKYNWNPIDTFEIIEKCLCGYNKCFLNEREIYWVEYYDSFKNGFNCTLGGSGNLGRKHSKETLKKMSESQLGKKHPEWRNEQKSEYTKGRRHTEEAKKLMSKVKKSRMTPELKQKISNAQKGREAPWALGNKGPSRKIKCLNNDTVYDSVKKACEILSLSASTVIHVLKGRQDSTKGFKFEYVNPSTKLDESSTYVTNISKVATEGVYEALQFIIKDVNEN